MTSEGSGGTRYAKGTLRRDLLVEAAAELLLEEGFAALSHRAVAARAGLPLASTTYYFTSGDDLRDAAVQHVAEGWSARAVSVVAALPDRVDGGQAAEAIVRLVGADAAPQQLLLLYERYLEAGRHPRLRSVVTEWNATILEMVREVLTRAGLPADTASGRLVLAVADGAAVTALAEGASTEAAVNAALTMTLSLLQRQR